MYFILSLSLFSFLSLSLFYFSLVLTLTFLIFFDLFSYLLWILQQRILLFCFFSPLWFLLLFFFFFCNFISYLIQFILTFLILLLSFLHHSFILRLLGNKIIIVIRHLHIYYLFPLNSWRRRQSPKHLIVIHLMIWIGHIWSWIINSWVGRRHLTISQGWRITHVVERIERIYWLLYYLLFSYCIPLWSRRNIDNFPSNRRNKDLNICWYTSVFLIKKIIFQFKPSLN